jgi:predicted nucleotidyltransferase
MIRENEKQIIMECAKKYSARSVFLFGSSIRSGEYHDIDLAVEGISANVFFKFYGELIHELPVPVDLIDLSKKSLFVDMVKEEGVKIYG